MSEIILRDVEIVECAEGLVEILVVLDDLSLPCPEDQEIALQQALLIVNSKNRAMKLLRSGLIASR